MINVSVNKYKTTTNTDNEKLNVNAMKYTHQQHIYKHFNKKNCMKLRKNNSTNSRRKKCRIQRGNIKAPGKDDS